MKALLLCMSSLMLILVSCTKDEEIAAVEYGTLTDIDGNVYKTVNIGGKWWMAENLRVSHFRDGSNIDYLPYTLNEDTTWANYNQPVCTYVSDSLFGKLYNFWTLQDSRQLAPEGWHVATDEDWMELEAELNMREADIQSTGWRGENQADLITSQFNVGWQASNSDVTLYGSNATGFNALPGGVRTSTGFTNIQGNTAFWWAPSAATAQPMYRYIDIITKRIFRQSEQKSYGMSVRCVKD